MAGVPANAAAAALNITVTRPAATGFVTVWPCGQALPNASNLNFTANQTVANLAMAALGTAGKVCIYSFATTDVIVDVAGYFPGGQEYSPIANPTRILDTRNNIGTGPTSSGGCRFSTADVPLNVAFCETFDAAGRQRRPLR